MDPKQRLLEVFDGMCEGEVPPDDVDVEQVMEEYGPEAIDKLCDGLEDCDAAAEAMWEEVRWKLTPHGELL